MDIAAILQRVEQVVTPVLEGLGLQLVDLEFRPGSGRAVLRLYVDYPQGGVSIGDCTRASRALEGVLDVEAEIPMAFTLEVSSPGVDRVLKGPADFAAVTGRVVDVQTRAPQDGRSHYKGRLVTVDAVAITVEADRQSFTIPLDNIAKARLRYFEKG